MHVGLPNPDYENAQVQTSFHNSPDLLHQLNCLYEEQLVDIQRLKANNEALRQDKAVAESETKSLHMLYEEQLAKKSSLETEIDKLRKALATSESKVEKMASAFDKFRSYHESYKQQAETNLRSRIAELQKSRRDQQHFVDLAMTTGVKKGRHELQKQMEVAWELVSGNRPFSYFQKRLAYAEKKITSSTPRSEPIPPFVDSEEETGH